MLSIAASPAWRTAHPGATFGLLELSRVDNTRPSVELQEHKRATEARLRERYQGFTRKEFLSLPVMVAYERYYKHFDKTYHVLLQLESIVLKGKNLPDVSPLVDANFSAEVETLILTAGHDADLLSGEILMDIAGAGDLITRMNGVPKEIDAGDMLMRDALGVCCTLIYGQDNRSPITVNTSHALYVSYAPPGVPTELVADHLSQIVNNIRLFTTTVQVEQLYLLKANDD
jgi:DNA/RNA-binding domain of Phe-tRNA-synthetase-like protein